MTGTCPHCGAELPGADDAFCPECRSDLDDAPSPDLSVQVPKAVRTVAEAINVSHLVKIGAALVAIAVAAILDLMDGKPSIAIALGTTIVAVTTLEWLRRSRRARRAQERPVPSDESGADGGGPS